MNAHDSNLKLVRCVFKDNELAILPASDAFKALLDTAQDPEATARLIELGVKVVWRAKGVHFDYYGPASDPPPEQRC